MPKLRLHSFALSLDTTAPAPTRAPPTPWVSAASASTSRWSPPARSARCTAGRAARRAWTRTAAAAWASSVAAARLVRAAH
jgi:hypothetical protein